MYLKRLPATELKIDRGFVQSFLTDLGRDSLQGFLPGGPTVGENFLAMVEAAT